MAIAIYFYFRSTSKQISLITAFLRLVYTFTLGIAVIQVIKIIPLLSADNTVPDTSEIVTSYFQKFEKIWSLGLVIFGFHLIGLGYLSVKSKSVPRFLGYLLYFGGVSYSFLHGSRQLGLFDVQTQKSIENILAPPMALAEILLAIWLIYNGF